MTMALDFEVQIIIAATLHSATNCTSACQKLTKNYIICKNWDTVLRFPAWTLNPSCPQTGTETRWSPMDKENVFDFVNTALSLNTSGRVKSLEEPYWYVGTCLLLQVTPLSHPKSKSCLLQFDGFLPLFSGFCYNKHQWPSTGLSCHLHNGCL